MDTVIIENKNLIYSIANMYKDYASIEDLFQAGCIGIIKAYKNYNPKFSTKFSTFAYSYILGEICEFIRRDRSIVISRDINKLYRDIVNAKSYLEQEYGHTPSDDEVVNYMGISYEEYRNIMLSSYSVESLDKSYDDIDLYNFISNNMDLDTIIALKEALNKLSLEERKIIIGQYIYGMNQEDIASFLGMNQVAVSRAKRRALTRLKTNFN